MNFPSWAIGNFSNDHDMCLEFNVGDRLEETEHNYQVAKIQLCINGKPKQHRVYNFPSCQNYPRAIQSTMTNLPSSS